jgi:hypothetical protein
MPAVRARTGPATADPVRAFFESLTEPGYLATFAGQSATLRFDITGGPHTERWHVAVQDGKVAVARHGSRPEAVIQISRPHFEDLAAGQLNAQTAILRGLLSCSGSMAAFIMFQRCLPSPPGSTGHVPPISSQAVMAARRPQ